MSQSIGGAVVTGRRTAELMDHWGGKLMGGVPIFVPSHRAPGPAARWSYPNVTYTDGIASAMEQAKAAAGDRHVHVQEVELEVVKVIDTPEATHLRYRVRR
jgi:dihydrofolate reductase